MVDGEGGDVCVEVVGKEGRHGFLEAVTEHVRPRTDEIPGGDEAVMEEVVMRDDEEEIWVEVEMDMRGGMVEAVERHDEKIDDEDKNGGAAVAPSNEDKVEDAEGKAEEDDDLKRGEKEGKELGEELWREKVEVRKKDVEGVVRKAPVGPTKEDREAHEALHAEHRGWCRHCVRGRGRNQAHKRRKGDREVREAGRVVRISMDYNFVGEDDEAVGTWLTMVESRFGAIWTRVVEAKGLNEDTEWVVTAMAEEIDEWGYRGEDVILRSDQEGAIGVVKRKLAEFRVTENALIDIGVELTAEHFVTGQYVDVVGSTKGKGFALSLIHI